MRVSLPNSSNVQIELFYNASIDRLLMWLLSVLNSSNLQTKLFCNASIDRVFMLLFSQP
jgi:hypothetical protein